MEIENMRSFSRFLTIILSSFLIIASLSPAYAVEINDAGAKNLKSQLSNYIDEYKNIVAPFGDTLDMKGDITVEQGRGYYAATLPSIIYKSSNSKKIKIGLTAINAIPTDNSKNWKISMAIPTPVLFLDQNDETQMRLDIGKQNIGGLWSFDLGHFVKLAAQYDDIKFTNLETNNVFGFAKTTINSNMTEKKVDVWSGTAKITVSDFFVDTPELKNAFTIENIENTSIVHNYSPTKYKQARKDFFGGNTDNSLFPSLSFLMDNALGDIQTNFSIKNMKFTNKENNKDTKIQNINFGYNAKQISDNNFNFATNISYDGLSATDMSDDIPKNFKTSISLTKLPIKDLIEIGQQAITENSKNDVNAKKVAVTKAVKFLPQKLKDAGTTLSLKDTKLGSDIYDIILSGDLQAEPSSKIGGAGSLNIETHGLDKLMKSLQENPKGKSLAQQLAIFRIISNEDKNKNTAVIKIDKEGKLSINGKDMSTIGGLLGGAQ